jgi:hypothetical protein
MQELNWQSQHRGRSRSKVLEVGNDAVYVEGVWSLNRISHLEPA